MNNKTIFLYLLFFIFNTLFAQNPQRINKLGVWNSDVTSPWPLEIIKNDTESDILNYRNTWKQLTTLSISGIHWNQGMVVYINKNSETYWNNFKNYVDEYQADEEEVEINYQKYPVGTILMAEHYILDKENNVPKREGSLMVMKKKSKGYAPKAGDWQYIQLTTSGKTLINGSATQEEVWNKCAKCHGYVANRDFVYSHFFAKK